MRIIILLLGLIALPGAIARSEPANQNRTVFVSPDGTFELQEVVPGNDDQDTKLFVVSKAKPDERQLLTTLPSLWIPRWYSSPDSKWLAAPTKEVHEVGNMQLFRRIDGLKFEKIPNFSDRAWGSLSAKRKYTKGEEGIIDLVSWSPDNARLLIALRGPVHGDSETISPGSSIGRFISIYKPSSLSTRHTLIIGILRSSSPRPLMTTTIEWR
jgi:hypothetical protein